MNSTEKRSNGQRKDGEVVLRNILEASGLYKAQYEPLITQAVQLSNLIEKCYEEIMSDGVTIVEIAREGERKKLHPVLTRYSELSKEYRSLLEEMGIACDVKTATTPQDRLTALIGGVESI